MALEQMRWPSKQTESLSEEEGKSLLLIGLEKGDLLYVYI